MIKWVTELQEYSFTFLVEKSTRASLADLLTYKEGPILVKEVDDHMVPVEEKMLDNAVLHFL